MLVEPWEDSFAADMLGDDAEGGLQCHCKTCKTAKWEKAAIVLNDPGQKYSMAIPLQMVRPMSIKKWIRNPPPKWVKWMAAAEEKKKTVGP